MRFFIIGGMCADTALSLSPKNIALVLVVLTERLVFAAVLTSAG
jgi:hypothetical protein